MNQPQGVSIALLAEMSLAAYQDEPDITPAGWECVAIFRTDYAFSVLFRSCTSNLWVLANRGTDEWFSYEGVNNLGMGLVDRLPDSVSEMMQSGIEKTAWVHAHQTILQAAAISGSESFYVTGHSQGGALTILQSAARRLPGVVFNPMTPRIGSSSWNRTDPSRFITVRHREDIAGKATHRTVGQLIELGERDSWTWLSPGQELLVKLCLPPAIGYVYNIAKYARVFAASVAAHLMGDFAYRIAANASFHADLNWIDS
jgi:hypothetical protein